MSKILQENTSEILATMKHRMLFSLRSLFFFNETKGVDPEWRGGGDDWEDGEEGNLQSGYSL